MKRKIVDKNNYRRIIYNHYDHLLIKPLPHENKKNQN